MRKFFTIIIAVLYFLDGRVMAQTPQWTIAVCSGGPPSSTISNVYGPMYSVATAGATNRTAVIYPASQLTTVAGTVLTNAWFHRNTTATMAGTPNFKIYLKEVAASTWGTGSITWATEITGATLVYNSNPVSVVGNSVGWVNFPFTTNFAYSGTQNLAVFFEYNNPTASAAITWSYDYNLNCTAALNDATKYTNNTTNTLPATLATTNLRRPYIGFDYILPPCITPPTPGNANVTTTTPCPGSNITFNLTGNTLGSGQTYDWETATSLSGPFISVSGPLTSSTYATTAGSPGVTYYRCAVTCGAATAYSDTIAVTVPALFPAGTYTINHAQPTGGNNFQKFSDAANAIKCGIAGAITFNVSPGSYNNDNFWLDSLNSNSTNTITVNGGGAILNYTGTTSDYAAIRFNNTSFVTINNLNIYNSATANSFGVSMFNNSDNNTISNCSITVDTTVTVSSVVAIAISGSATSATTSGSDCDNNIITGNIINGGYYGISLYGSTTSNIVNTVTNNTIKNFYLYGCILTYNNGTVIEGNDFTRPTRTSSSTTAGFLLSTGNQNTNATRNRIHNLFDAMPTSTSACYPIYVSGADATVGNENIISNNLVYDIKNQAGTVYGIYNAGADRAKFYHNTIILDGPTNAGTEITRGIYQTTAATNIEFINNIFVVQRAGGDNHGIYMNTPGTTFTSNNNDFFIGNATNNHIGYLNSTSYTALASWQTANSQDANSFDINPVFSNSSSNDYTPFAASIDNVGAPVGITTDILNTSRNLSTPDIGAYEFNVPLCTSPPTPGTASASPLAVCSGGNVSFNLTGNSTGVGQTYTWESSTSANGPFVAVSTANNSSTFSNPITVTEYYRCAITCGTSTTYSDTILVTAYQPLVGNYTINSNTATGGTNFQTFGDMVAALNCGIAGPVVIDVAPGSGPYNERVVLNSITGSSASNTITINGNGGILSYLGSVSAQRGTLVFNGADFVTVKNLKIEATDLTYGWGVHFTNDADNDSLVNCNISIATTSTTAANSAGVVISGSMTSITTAGNSDNIVIANDTITGAYSGIVVTGGSSSLLTGNKILNNTISDFYATGIDMSYNTAPVIANNDIKRATRAAVTTFTGIELGAGNTQATVNANRIHDTHNGATTQSGTTYGIFLSACDATVGNENIISNNLLYNFNSGSGTIYALYNSGSDGVHYFHNTVVLDNAASTAGVTRGFFQTTAATNIEFKNNIIYISRGGTGLKYCLYFATTTSAIVSNNNVLYMASTAGTNGIGFYSAGLTTLANWQTANSSAYDQQSVDANPVFANVAAGNFEPTTPAVNDIGIPLANVTSDINNNTRSSTIPDPGAYEWNPPACIAPPTAGVVNVPDTDICTGASLTFDLSGNSTGYTQTYQWQSAPSPTGPFTTVNTGSTPIYTTNITASVYYRCAVTCNSLTSYSDTVHIVAKTALPGGTYTVNSAVPTSGSNFNSLQEAADAMECGITGAVVLNVAPGSGPYVNQQMVFPASLVTSATNTITINGNGATLVSNCQDPNQRAAIALYGTDYVTINNLVIDASTGTYNWGIFFTQQADHNKISNCIIKSNTTTTSGQHTACPIVFSGSNTATTTQANNGNYDTLINNTIIGGHYGVAMYGAAATPLVGNVIANNISQDAYAYNLLTVYNNGTIIRDNDVSRPTRTNSTTYAGIYVNNPSTNIIVERNRIHNIADNISASFTAYVIYMNAADGTAVEPNVVRNNAVYNINGAGARFGIRNAGSDYWSVYHNTISIDNQIPNTTEAHGIYQVTAATNFDIKNNIITVTRPTSGVNSGININTATTTYTSNYNDVYVTNGGTNNFGLVGTTAYPTMSSWRTGTTQDLNSDTLQPFYANTLIGDLKPTNSLMDNKGTPIAGITTDILNVVRSATTPDYGAFEFIPPVCPPPAQLAISNTTGNSATLSWSYVNNNAPALGYQYYYSTSSTAPASNAAASGSGTTGTTASIASLNSSTPYYAWVRSICSTADTSAWSQPISFRTKPANDSARNATLLIVGTSICNGINYNGDVGGATAETNEPIISCEQRTNATTSVWYKFDAPASGMVKISTDYMVSAYDSLTDGKMGVYSVTDSSDFSTFQIVGCDEDNGIIGAGWRTLLYLGDLTPGARYYIKVDKNDASNPDAAFCIDVMPMTPAMVSTNDNCGGAGYNNNSGWHNGKSAWVSMLDNNGLLIYNMKTNANTAALGAMPNKFYEQSGPSRFYNGTPYLNRNYEITSATAPASPITLQFFFTDADYSAMQSAKPGLTMTDLNVTRLSGAACSDTFNPTGQTVSLLTQLANGAANGVRYINVSTPGFSSFFIHADNHPLFIRLEKISAVNLGDNNRVDWNTLEENSGDHFELERSLDGKTFERIANVPAKGTPSQYSYLDEDAQKGINYYRLKLFDQAGRFNYSPVVKAIVGGEGVFIVEAFPNPAHETVTVQITGKQSSNALLQLLDVTGKAVQNKPMTGSTHSVNISSLASGVYLLKYTDDSHNEVIRITKE